MARSLSIQSLPSPWPLFTLLLATFLFITPISADADADAARYAISKFFFPVGGETFYYSDVLNITFRTPIRQPLIKTHCKHLNDEHREATRDSPPPDQKWMLARTNYTNVKLCWFQLMATDKEPDMKSKGIDSIGFTIIPAQRAETTLGLPAPFAATATATGEVVGSVPTSSSSSTATSAPDTAPGSQNRVTEVGPSGLNAGAIAGISIVVALLSAGAAAIGIIFWHRRRGRNRTQAEDGEGEQKSSESTRASSTIETESELEAEMGRGGHGAGPEQTKYRMNQRPAGRQQHELAA